MATEIERKFLIDTSHPEVQKLFAGPSFLIRQGYIHNDEKGVIRIRIAGENAFVTIKGRNSGIVRQEYEYDIPVEDAERLLSLFEARTLTKRRYHYPLEGNLLAEVDVFLDFELAIAEVELPDEKTTFTQPEWFRQEVSSDPTYYNNNLISRLR